MSLVVCLKKSEVRFIFSFNLIACENLGVCMLLLLLLCVGTYILHHSDNNIYVSYNIVTTSLCTCLVCAGMYRFLSVTGLSLKNISHSVLCGNCSCASSVCICLGVCHLSVLSK